MQVIIKVIPGRESDLEEALRSAVGQAFGRSVASQVSLQRVFPRGTLGNRGLLYTLSLPDILRPSDVAGLGNLLFERGIAEFMHRPAPRRPL